MDYITRAEFSSVNLGGVVVLPHPLQEYIGGLIAGGGQAAAPLRIVTGVNMGLVRISIERLDEAPSAPSEVWEDVVEISCQSTSEAAFAQGPTDTAPAVTFLPEGPEARWFRLRVCARQRDVEFDQATSTAREAYLLQAWPASPPTVPAVLRAASQTAKRYRNTRSPQTGVTAGVSFSGPLAGEAERQAAAELNLRRVSRRSET